MLKNNIAATLLLVASVLLAYHNYQLCVEIGKLTPVYNKYVEFDKIIMNVAQREYTDKYRCVEFSNDLVKELSTVGIQANKIVGESPKTKNDNKTNHAWVGVWFEPQTGAFTKDYFVK